MSPAPPERDLLPVDLQEMVAEVRRELELRKTFYHRATSTGRMNRKLADRRIDIMEALLAKLEAERDAHPGEAFS